MAPNGFAVLKQACDRLAESPFQRALGVFRTCVNLRARRLNRGDDGSARNGNLFWQILEFRREGGGGGKDEQGDCEYQRRYELAHDTSLKDYISSYTRWRCRRTI